MGVVSLGLSELHAEGTRGGLQLRQHAAQACLQTPLLRRSGLRGNGKEAKALEGLVDFLQAFFAFGGSSRCGRVGGLWPHPPQRGFQKCAPFRLIGQAVSGQQRQSLTQLQVVGLDRTEKGILLAGRQST